MKCTRHLVVIASLFIWSCQSRQSDKEPVIVYHDKDTTSNYYLALHPQIEPKGLLVVLPGFSSLPADVLNETDLPAKSQSDGYLVVIPCLAERTFYTDSLSQDRLATLLQALSIKYNIPESRLILGGHSAGGNGALLYAERAFSEGQRDLMKPAAVFAVDPPMDMERLWQLFTYLDRINYNEVSSEEARYFLKRFQTELGGTPAEVPDRYRAISSFSRDAENGGGLQYLKDIPVRLYCDADLQWYIEERRLPVEYANVSDLSASIVQLLLLGNERAELINSPGKGHLTDGRRHPHAFSQLDANEFLIWANSLMRYGDNP